MLLAELNRFRPVLSPVSSWHLHEGCPSRWQPFFFWVAGSIIDRMICIEESRGFLAVKVLNNFNRSTTRLFYKARPPFGRLPKDCGWWHPVVGPEGGTPAPTLSRRFRGSGSQRVPLSTVMNANGGADAGHKRRLENRLMVRRRDPYGSRRRGSGVRRTFESMLRSRINIAARPLGIAAISRP